MAITTINENDYIKDSRSVINDNFSELDTLKAPLESPALTGTPTAPTPTPDDDSTKIATTAYVQAELADYATLTDMEDYLPLSGGTMTGNILFSPGGYVGNGTSGKDVVIGYDFDDGNGALIGLHSTSYPETGLEGSFDIIAKNGNTYKSLVGKPDGTLTWDGKNIARDVKTGSGNGTISVNGSDVAVKGLGSRAYDSTSYLPLSGGTMTGTIKRNGDVIVADNDQYTRVNGGSNSTSGASLTLGGKNHSWAGRWELKAHDGTNSQTLAGTAAGTLTWGGLDIAPQTLSTAAFNDKNVASGTLTNLGNFTLTKGTWLITASVVFASNSTGYRHIAIGNSTSTDQINRFSSVTYRASENSTTHIVFSNIHNVSSNTTLYLNVSQNSGSTLGTSNSGVRLFRLSNDA